MQTFSRAYRCSEPKKELLNYWDLSEKKKKKKEIRYFLFKNASGITKVITCHLAITSALEKSCKIQKVTYFIHFDKKKKKNLYQWM